METVAVYKIKHSIHHILSKLVIYPAQSNTNKELITPNKQEYIRSTVQGVFHSTLVAGDEVTEGQVVGHITNEFVEPIKTLHSPLTGITQYKFDTPQLNP